MKIKTITCHDVYNYGASLQAYALQRFLQNNGNEVEIIDYRPDYIDFSYKISKFVHPNSPVRKYTEKNKILLLLYALKRFLWYLPSIKRKRAFDRFTKKYLKLTRTYHTFDELKKDTPIADTYIVGSDQVWNSVTMLNGSDPAFYLQFCHSDRRKISYAASFGSTSISKKYEKNIIQWLSFLDAISVRENTGVPLLQELGFFGTHVCDPVFLLSREEWTLSFSISQPINKYVLIYNLTSINEKLVSDAKQTADYLGMQLYSVSPMDIAVADKNFKNVGPEDFVSLIFNASFVFTNSFHATAFSIISQRQFCTYNYHSKSNSSRMHSVLSEFDLLDRLNIDNINKIIETPIDYNKKKSIIEYSINNGKKWLLSNI